MHIKKGNITTKIIATAVVSAFMVGCNSSTYIAKRKYTDGYYIATSKGVNHKVVKSETTKEVTTVLESKQVQTLNITSHQELSINKTIIENNVIASVNDIIAKTQATKTPFVKITTMTEASSALTKREKHAAIKQALKKATINARKSSDADTDMKILCVILCFFLPPLAIYLIQDEITKSFWVNVILMLVGFVLLFTIIGIPIAILFLLASLIHGLVVVLKS